MSYELALVWMIVAQLLTLGSLAIWLVFAVFSLMAFDSGYSRWAVAVVVTAWAYPLIPLALSVGAWINFASRNYTAASVLIALAFLPPVSFAIMIRFADGIFVRRR